MAYEATWIAVTVLLFSLITLWMSEKEMISRKSIRSFLPFFLLGFILAFYGAAILFEFFFNVTWFFLEFMIFASLIWILVDIWRESL